MSPTRIEERCSAVYYSPMGYWKGVAAIKKLASVAGVSESAAREYLKRQALWQVYLGPPKYIPRPFINEEHPNTKHQADLLYLPHDKVGRRLYKYCLTVVDVASRYKAAEPLTTKNSTEAAEAFKRIYKTGPLTWPKLLQVDSGSEFKGATSALLIKHQVQVQRAEAGNHRQQGIVERYNRTLSERLFGAQYAHELLMAARGSSERSAAWVRALPEVVQALNNEVTQLIKKKPAEAIKTSRVKQNPSRPVRTNLPILEPDALVRYLYAPGELEGGSRRATDPVWSLTVHNISNVVQRPRQPALYYLNTPAPKRGFVREELMVVPASTQLPPSRLAITSFHSPSPAGT